MDQTGKIIRARREALGLSQDQLAWLADVSKTTIRNIEADRVDEARKWSQIEVVLGWQPGSLDQIKAGQQPSEIMTTSAVALIIKAMRRQLSVNTRLEYQVGATEEAHKHDLHAIAKTEGYQTATSAENNNLLSVALDNVKESVAVLSVQLNQMRNKLVENRRNLETLRRDYITAMEDSINRADVPIERRAGSVNLLTNDVEKHLSLNEVREVTRALEVALGIESMQDVVRQVSSSLRKERGGGQAEGDIPCPEWGSPNLVESIESGYKKKLEGKQSITMRLSDPEALANMENVAVVSQLRLPENPEVSMVVLLFHDPQKRPVINKEDFRLFIEATDLIEGLFQKKSNAANRQIENDGS